MRIKSSRHESPQEPENRRQGDQQTSEQASFEPNHESICRSKRLRFIAQPDPRRYLTQGPLERWQFVLKQPVNQGAVQLSIGSRIILMLVQIRLHFRQRLFLCLGKQFHQEALLRFGQLFGERFVRIQIGSGNFIERIDHRLHIRISD